MQPAAVSPTGLAITNPLVLYRALLATNRIAPDQGQLRLALHLQKVYERLKDYEPTVEYSHRLRQLNRIVPEQGDGVPDVKSIGTRGVWQSLLAQKEKRESLALTRSLTSHELAKSLDSPRGLMLHGEVGTGKSMLVDLFADCLPNKKKRRWHFNTFMLETFAKLEHLRMSRSTRASLRDGEDDHSLLWLARDIIKTSPILFLDEFQLPDRAASKIMSNLMTSFFQLGGVLIATSNRMPEELAKAAGVEFGRPPAHQQSLRWRLGMTDERDRAGIPQNPYGRGEFGEFLDVLKARCDIWEMDGGKDYRRREADSKAKNESGPISPATTDDRSHITTIGPGHYTSSTGAVESDVTKPTPGILPTHYFIQPSVSSTETSQASYNSSLETAIQRATNYQSSPILWLPTSMRVYGRTVPIPRHLSSVTFWTFSELCGKTLGPADYITLASTFHTFIITDIPILTILQKNEARRFITLLDALYEAKCKLLITAAAGPDDLFFPETAVSKDATRKEGNEEEQFQEEDAVYPETFSEVYQDATAPFRPNISSYVDGLSSRSAPAEPQPVQPSYASPTLAPDALEDDPPNRARRTGDTYFSDQRDTHPPQAPSLPRSRQRSGPDFFQTTAFTGEDERFAYKRARSRLWEMCGEGWWARDEPGYGWWRPVPSSARPWEHSSSPLPISPNSMEGIGAEDGVAGEGMGPSRDVGEKDDSTFIQGAESASPFRTAKEPPPKISWTHVWGTVRWGKKAGAWGKGIEGLEERRLEKEQVKGDGDGKGKGGSE
ncbi:hypothetical protein K402DRAFT_462430 [Aulographum hederae CBS 113979]|uniref:AAA+ ATPase domain-containing protein n=1 Tax=Aulographum hederae CBS 113979 TaxID=1176131 RepID=A0A6G1H4T8_9PEZI|nr:hypothetical protein K402DRAFT_462430 [Aulographum hederae CBS 113979]